MRAGKIRNEIAFRTILLETRLAHGIWIESVQRVDRVIGALSCHIAWRTCNVLTPAVHPHSSTRAYVDMVSVT